MENWPTDLKFCTGVRALPVEKSTPGFDFMRNMSNRPLITGLLANSTSLFFKNWPADLKLCRGGSSTFSLEQYFRFGYHAKDDKFYLNQDIKS